MLEIQMIIFLLVILVLNPSHHLLTASSLTCGALKLWNALPLEVRSADSVDVLQAKLKRAYLV